MTAPTAIRSRPVPTPAHNASSPQKEPLVLDIRGVSIGVPGAAAVIVDSASLQIAAGEIVGIVGESGSGKTVLAKSIMQLQPPSMHIVQGEIHVAGRSVAALSAAALRGMRGATVGMVFQEPMTSLNPAMRIGRQLEEGLILHRPSMSPQQRLDAIDTLLHGVGLRDPAAARQAFPHHFSGGMRQRILLASVMLLEPALLIADEPTTALDVLVQRDVLDLMLTLTKASRTAVLLISHDLSVIARYTQRIVVMEKGRIVEQGATTALLAAPAQPYTRKLVASIPRRMPAALASEACAAVPLPGDPAAAQPRLLEVRDLVVRFPISRQGPWWKPGRGRATSLTAIDGVNITIHRGETVALVGGSGSGKTTLGRTIAGLQKATSGTLLFQGKPVDPVQEDYRLYRDQCQIIFQDPFASLDPRMTIGALIAEGLGPSPAPHAGTGTSAGRADRSAALMQKVRSAMDEVELPASLAQRFPHELSGGQRQRVAIARALIRRPAFVVADEAVSALDMTVRARILALLAQLQRDRGFACLFITHDLGAAEQVSDRIVVMHKGKIIEEGSCAAIFNAPQQPYTRALLAADAPLIALPNGGVTLKPL